MGGGGGGGKSAATGTKGSTENKANRKRRACLVEGIYVYACMHPGQ